MSALVVYESVYGNTRAVAEAIAIGLQDANVLPVSEVRAGDVSACDLLVVGGPTHVHGMATSRSRELAAEMARDAGQFPVEEHADADPGLRTWLHMLPDSPGPRAAAFDTRLEGSPLLTGTAARGIARRLRGRGYAVVAIESFLVAATEGPIRPGELDRARAWGIELAAVTGEPEPATAGKPAQAW